MSTIKAIDVAYVRFAAPDLAKMAGFLKDFGLTPQEHGSKLYGVGRDGAPFVHVTEQGEPAFRALGLRAASLTDLETLARAEGKALVPCDAPGGGSMLSLTDPDGRCVEVVAGQSFGAEPAAHDTARIWNNSHARNRKGRAALTTAKPSTVIRLGHIVLDVGDFRACETWYKERFGLITSDEIEMMPGHALGAFMRCDRGDIPTDHHTLFLLQHPNGPGFNHAAFEVADLDDLMTGHDHLKDAGHAAQWGIGRHILGNQVFDYWRDPWDHVLEHWTDGDRMIAADGSATATLDDLLGVQWGPPMTMPQ
jgi:catechol 2,3-dioxygenase-like lactoylglutathione lyase family enzyme